MIEQSNGTESGPIKSEVEKWISGANVVSRWKKIGAEIYARKSLMFAAAEDLKNYGVENHLSLAATDVFVEKAQKLLTRRALWNMSFGVLMSAMTFAMILYGSVWLYRLDIVSDILEYGKLDNLLFWLLLLKATTAGAIFGAAIYFSMALSRALLHEGTVLFSRRHALRFGRLYVYLTKGNIVFKDLEDAFKWNAEFTSAFKDIKPEKASGHPAQRVLQEVANIIEKSKEFASAVKSDSASESDKPSDQAKPPTGNTGS